MAIIALIAVFFSLRIPTEQPASTPKSMIVPVAAGIALPLAPGRVDEGPGLPGTRPSGPSRRALDVRRALRGALERTRAVGTHEARSLVRLSSMRPTASKSSENCKASRVRDRTDGGGLARCLRDLDDLARPLLLDRQFRKASDRRHLRGSSPHLDDVARPDTGRLPFGPVPLNHRKINKVVFEINPHLTEKHHQAVLHERHGARADGIDA